MKISSTAFSPILCAISLCSLLAYPRAQAQITETELTEIIQVFHSVYDSEMKANQAYFEINPVAGSSPAMKSFWWDRDEIKGHYSTFFDTDRGQRAHYIHITGGYARINGMTRDGVAATLCHELGHGLGGEPFKDLPHEKFPISVEGQADDYAYRVCLPRIFKVLGGSTQTVTQARANTIQKICATTTQDRAGYCFRAMQAIETERIFLALNNPEDPNTDIDRRSLDTATETILKPDYYPSSQCRIDTMINAILNRSRPACWYAESKNK